MQGFPSYPRWCSHHRLIF